MIRIGLTGGIGVGKSTLCDFFKSLGAEIINCDQLAHQSIQQDGLNYKPVIECFGRSISYDNGDIDRKKLGAIVFADTERLKQLNSICHDAIRKMWQNKMRDLAIKGCKVVVTEVPLLFEIGVQSDFDRTIVLGSSLETQVKRMLDRGYEESTIHRRIEAMWSIEKKMSLADYVIWNDRDLRTLQCQASAIMSHIVGGEAVTTLL